MDSCRLGEILLITMVPTAICDFFRVMVRNREEHEGRKTKEILFLESGQLMRVFTKSSTPLSRESRHSTGRLFLVASARRPSSYHGARASSFNYFLPQRRDSTGALRTFNSAVVAVRHEMANHVIPTSYRFNLLHAPSPPANLIK